MKVDFDKYDLFFDNKQIGHFEYDFIDGTYECQMDLRGLNFKSYQNLITVLKKEFPEIKL